MPPPLLEVINLKKHFRLKGGRGVVHAVDDVGFRLNRGETLGVVGESGCGKSTLARVILRLIEPTSGGINFQGEDLRRLKARELRARRKEMQLIFQDAYASLDARQKIGSIIAEPLVVHGIGTRASRKERVADLLKTVGLTSDAASCYPHEFSGGQRQRIGIARAMALEPRLVIADEPVSALDVSIQSQILNLLIDLREELRLSYIFISHDMAVVEHVCDKIAVMYLGRIVEKADKETLFSAPGHPYTRALLSAIPHPDPSRVQADRIVLTGDIPNPENPPPGCRFHTRCPSAFDMCKTSLPEMHNLGTGEQPHLVGCHLYSEQSSVPETQTDHR